MLSLIVGPRLGGCLWLKPEMASADHASVSTTIHAVPVWTVRPASPAQLRCCHPGSTCTPRISAHVTLRLALALADGHLYAGLQAPGHLHAALLAESAAGSRRTPGPSKRHTSDKWIT